MIKILVSGASGRMGQETVKALQASTHLKFVGGTLRHDDLAKAITQHNPDVVVDFTVASQGQRHAEIIIEHNVHPVMGTTGFSEKTVKILQELCEKKQLGAIIAPNFSIAAVLMMQYASLTSKYFPDAEIIEAHHPKKEESPSGTAIKTAELIAANRKEKPAAAPHHAIIPHARGATHHDVPIHAIRLPGLIAEQSVIFGGDGETLCITHRTFDRVCFMPGVMLACEKVMMLKKLVYGLENIL
jgi:4-hydroxy-tetrahydrodipicolinate reductase